MAITSVSPTRIEPIVSSVKTVAQKVGNNVVSSLEGVASKAGKSTSSQISNVPPLNRERIFLRVKRQFETDKSIIDNSVLRHNPLNDLFVDEFGIPYTGNAVQRNGNITVYTQYKNGKIARKLDIHGEGMGYNLSIPNHYMVLNKKSEIFENAKYSKNGDVAGIYRDTITKNGKSTEFYPDFSVNA